MWTPPSLRLPRSRALRPLLSALVLALAGLSTACSEPEAPPAAEASRPSMVAAGSSEAAPSLAERLDSATWVDLTYTYDESTIYWPTSPSAFEKEELAYGETEAGFFYSAYSICTPEHGGTHLDAPIHFAAERQTVDQIPLETLAGPAVVIDVAEKAAADPDYLLTAEDVRAFEAEHGEIAAGTIVLLYTGWGARWGDRLAYLGDDTPGDASNLHFPSFGKESAELLVNERRVAVIGVDTASIDHGPSTDFIAHQIANGANVPGLENVANLDRLPPTGAYLIALPMKIGGGSGAPVRVVAILP
ncbi:MAG: cyclase family protein [Holophagales bacterium]|nr:cyclase family protein [Holophagales bacterium]